MAAQSTAFAGIRKDVSQILCTAIPTNDAATATRTQKISPRSPLSACRAAPINDTTAMTTGTVRRSSTFGCELQVVGVGLIEVCPPAEMRHEDLGALIHDHRRAVGAGAGAGRPEIANQRQGLAPDHEPVDRPLVEARRESRGHR